MHYEYQEIRDTHHEKGYSVDTRLTFEDHGTEDYQFKLEMIFYSDPYQPIFDLLNQIRGVTARHD